MTLDSIHVYSNNLQADVKIYQFLMGSNLCPVGIDDNSVLFDNGNFWLLLEDGRLNKDRVGRFTGLNFSTCSLNEDCLYLINIGAEVNKARPSDCNNYLLVDCRDLSGNQLTLIQVNESDHCYSSL